MFRLKFNFMAIVLAVFVLFLVTGVVFADVAPPEKPPGSSLHPGSEVTQVRMLAETVLIDVQAENPEGTLGVARVNAEFQMRNLSSEAETLMVRFPISNNDGFYNFLEIEDFQVQVNSSPVPTTRAEYIGGQFDDVLQWAEFPVDFPPGEDVSINVAYTLRGTGEYPFISFAYLLETGAGWKDTIGRVDLIVRLPYEANHRNVFIDESPGWGHTSPGEMMEGNEIRWHYDDLEPEYQHNLSVVMVMPSAWEKVLTERGNVAANPDDGEAWGRLGKIYKETALLRRGVRRDAGGMELFDLSREAYEKCLELLPNDALWHAGYADLLFSRYYWEEFMSGGYQLNNILKAIEEYHIAYTLAPNNARIQEMMLDAYYGSDAIDVVDDEYIFSWLTVTPTLAPTRTPTPEG